MKTPSNIRSNACFTLVELLVSMAILTLLLVMLASIVNQTSSMWSTTRGKIEQFRDARDGFESMTRRISQATLNTYWDYQDASGKARTPTTSAAFVPARYARQSELRFISGPSSTLFTTGAGTRPTDAIFFQAPLGVVSGTTYGGLQYLLNTWGYYIEYADDSALRPSFVKIPARNRFRLMEVIQPSEDMTLYTHTSGTSGSSTYTGKEWYTDALSSVHVLAENIIALVILPKLAPEEEQALITSGSLSKPLGTNLSPTYLYDSTTTSGTAVVNPKNQLPPVVQVTMVAIDDVSAGRMSDTDNDNLKDELNSLFKTASSFDTDLRRDATNHADITTDPSLEAYLIQNKINYRIFTTNVSIKGAKWSRAQTN